MSVFAASPSSPAHNGFALASSEDMDPSLADGSRIVWDMEVPIECRTQSGGDGEGDVLERHQQGVLESIKVRLLVLGSDDSPSSIRIELSSEADLFFHYMHVIDEPSFKVVAEEQKLIVSGLSDYLRVLTAMLAATIREPHVHLAVFTMTVGTSDGRIDFVENKGFRYSNLLSVSFERSPEEVTQLAVSYRYNSVKKQLAMTTAKLFELNNLVKTKNPSLLLHLGKGNNNNSSGSSSSSGPGSASKGHYHHHHNGGGKDALELSAITTTSVRR